MRKSIRLGIYLHYTHYGNNKYTFINAEGITFIQKAALSDEISLLASVIRNTELSENDFRIVLEKDGIKVHSLPGWKDLPASILSIPFSLKSLIKTIKKFVTESDLIWLRIPSAVAFIVYSIAKKTGKPIIIHVAGNILLTPRPEKYKGIKLFFVKIVSLLLHQVTKFMTRNALVLVAGGELRSLLHKPHHPAYLFDDTLITQKDLIPPLKKQGHAKNILFVGRFDFGKGIKLLINAIATLKKEFPEITLRMAGTGTLYSEVEQYIQKKNLNTNIELLGFVPSNGPLQKLYREADIAVIPSDSYPEGFPRVILEAWAAGLPIIATKFAGIPYTVVDKKNGLLIPPGNLQKLIEALKNLILNDKLRYNIAQGGSKTVSTLTMEHQRKKIHTLLNKQFPGLQLPDYSKKQT